VFRYRDGELRVLSLSNTGRAGTDDRSGREVGN